MNEELETRDDGLNQEQVKKLAKSYNSEDERLIKEGVSHLTLKLLSDK